MASIGRYEIRGELGRGMMGVVYEAFDPDLHRTVALKTIHLAFAAAAEEQGSFEQRFFAEGRAAARLSHPAIVIVHDIGRDAATGTLYIALEHLHGRTLADVLRTEAPLPWREALRIVRALAEGLHHAHAQGVVHRDVKPANVMLLESGEPKIMDFGIAKIEASQLTAAGQFFGTPLYMSPEQAGGTPVDGRSDLFSLGAIAYALLTGATAFGGDSVPVILSRVLTLDPPPPSRAAPGAGIPPQADRILARALAKAPADRYPDGRAFAEDLGDVLEGRPPRHLVGWAPPRPAEGTLAHEEVDELRGQLEALTEDRPAPAPVATVAPARVAPAFIPLTPAAVAVAAVAVVLVVLAGWALRRGGPDAVVPGAAVARRIEPDRPAEAPLTIAVEHDLRSGRVRAWVDDQLLLEENLGGRVTQRVLGLERRRGSLEQHFDVEPGRRVVKVQVTWDGNVKTASVSADFEPGTPRRLVARLDGIIRKTLLLSWE